MAALTVFHSCWCHDCLSLCRPAYRERAFEIFNFFSSGVLQCGPENLTLTSSGQMITLTWTEDEPSCSAVHDVLLYELVVLKPEFPAPPTVRVHQPALLTFTITPVLGTAKQYTSNLVLKMFLGGSFCDAWPDRIVSLVELDVLVCIGVFFPFSPDPVTIQRADEPMEARRYSSWLILSLLCLILFHLEKHSVFSDAYYVLFLYLQEW